MNPERRAILEKLGIGNGFNLGLQNTLWFGKFKGKSVDHIIATKVTYITYCLDEGIFTLNNEAFKKYNDFMEDYKDRESFGEIRPDEY